MKEYIQQLLMLWRQLGLNQKVSVAVSTVGIMVAVVGVLYWSGQSKFELLYGRMEASDMSEAVNIIEAKGIPYKIEGGGSSLYVPGDKVYALRMELATKGIPSGGGVGFEIFDETSFGISDFVQKTNYTRAIQGELARTISQLDGVRSTRVMISVPENRLLADQAKRKATASVFIDTGGRTLSESAVNSIRFLVANSVEGLTVDNVAVVDNNGRVLSEALTGEGAIGVASGRLRFQQGMEEYYSNKVESMLTKVVGPDQVVARVSVKVDTESATVVEERYDPAGQVVRSQVLTEDTSVSDDRSPSQVSGQAGGAVATVSQPVSSSKDVNKKKTISYEISKSRTETVKTPGTLREISAAVFIALREKEENGAMVPNPRTQEEIKLIKDMVINALGASTLDIKDVGQKVTVQEVPFAREKIVETASVMAVPDFVYEWGDVLKKYSSIGLALVMFMVFRRMVKNYKPKLKGIELLEDSRQVGSGMGGNGTPVDTVELINTMIKQKPDNVGEALKNWVSSEK